MTASDDRQQVQRDDDLSASLELALDPLQIRTLYGYPFKIERGFRQAVHVMGAYAYHFWMADMKPIRRGSGDQSQQRFGLGSGVGYEP